MKFIKRKQVLINNVLPLGKGEVACSNHAGSTTFSLIINLLRTPLFWVLACIYTGFIVSVFS